MMIWLTHRRNLSAAELAGRPIPQLPSEINKSLALSKNTNIIPLAT
jgi:hypothetical protein